MSQLRYIIVLTLCLLPAIVWGQRRYSTGDKVEYSLQGQRGFSTKDVENKTDALIGIHASLYSGSHHLIGFSLEGSWSTFISTMPQTSFKPGGGSGGAHFLYEYQYSGFLLQTGLGLAYQRVKTPIADTVIYHENMIDPYEGKFTLKHYFYNRLDEAQHIYAQLPLYFGHYFFGEHGIGYFLAGLHFNYAVWGNTRQTLIGTTTGKYEKYVGIWEEMDNHGFRKDVPIERKGSQLKLKFDMMAHAEIGYEYNTQQGAKDYRIRPMDRMDGRIRFAAFADFGILNSCPNTDNPFYETPEETIYDFPTYRMEHVYSTQDAKKYWMRNLFVGLRVTFLFGFEPDEKCILCDPWKH
ncbi:MAG: hypothetical protein J5884_06970 [Paludibacteraceae bacterium]|nr:hypothetical protein [Paludibacteraceae bacterium]